MLSDPKEIEIISRARQKNVRNYKRSREHFIRIFEDFLWSVDFDGKRQIDLGPGHFDFGVLAAERNGVVSAVDNDPAVVELGHYKGFSVIDGRLQDIADLKIDGEFDGVFCKFSLNMFWFYEDLTVLREFLETVVRLHKKDGWAWLAFWNGAPSGANLDQQSLALVLETGASVFGAHGYQRHALTEGQAKYYGVHGATVDRTIYTYNLSPRLKKWRRNLFRLPGRS